MSFFTELYTQTAPEQAAFAAIPQIRDGLAGRISRETYVAYLAQAYHHVSHTVSSMLELIYFERPSPALLRDLSRLVGDAALPAEAA